MYQKYFNRPLIEVKIENVYYRVTKSPFRNSGVILWFLNESNGNVYEILGSFSCYDKFKILQFISHYVTNSGLRKKIAKKRFEKWLSMMTPQDIQKLDGAEGWSKIHISQSIFNLDMVFDQDDLKMRHRLLAKHFHPDKGGDVRYMALINDAYDCLSNISKGKKYNL